MSAIELLEAMNGIDGNLIENAQPKPQKSNKTFIRLILLAALIAVLTMTAFAAEEITNWFMDYFSQRAPAGLTENQIVFIEENTTDISKS